MSCIYNIPMCPTAAKPDGAASTISSGTMDVMISSSALIFEILALDS